MRSPSSTIRHVSYTISNTLKESVMSIEEAAVASEKTVQTTKKSLWDWANLILGGAIAVWSLLLIKSGAGYIIATSGYVTGSEFGMLITLVSIGGDLMIWLGLFSLWTLVNQVRKGTFTLK